jgi:hypothetical protein
LGAAEAGAGCGRVGSELENPAPNGFRGDFEAPLGQEFFDVTVAGGEAQTKPHSMSDDLGRELVTVIGNGLHALPYRKPLRTVTRSHDNAGFPHCAKRKPSWIED